MTQKLTCDPTRPKRQNSGTFCCRLGRKKLFPCPGTTGRRTDTSGEHLAEFENEETPKASTRKYQHTV